MSCYEPLHGFIIGLTDEKKNKLLVTSNKVKAIDKQNQPIYKDIGIDETSRLPSFVLPCGHCLGCREDQSKEWSNRLIMESLYHDTSYFLTLTYDDDHIPIVESLDEETGEYFIHSSLCKRDIQLFIKRLRRANPNDHIRYYIAGEYGETTDRAHYHAIVYGLHVYDLVPFGRSETGNQYFISESLSKIWSNGFVSIEPANEYTFKYVANYVTKKLGIGFEQEYKDKGLVPPFSMQSLKPGIGYKYLDENKEKIIERDYIVLGTEKGSYSFNPPRYFYKKFWNEEDLEVRSARRRASAEAGVITTEARTDLKYIDYLQVKKISHEKRLKQRDGV